MRLGPRTPAETITPTLQTAEAVAPYWTADQRREFAQLLRRTAAAIEAIRPTPDPPSGGGTPRRLPRVA